MLDQKRILITGGARGLGLAFAQSVSALGAAVVIADVLEDQGREASDTLRRQSRDVSFVAVDLASPESIERCAGEVAARFDALDGLVNNGAIATGIGGDLFADIPVSTWDRVMSVNVRGTWLMSAACLPLLKASPAGRIVNIASDTPLWGAPRLLHYVASKGAVIAMTRSMARELGADGITVNSVSPGLTQVEATASVPEARHRLYVEGRAIRREQLPEDVTGTVAYLLSALSASVTGQNIPVNGGFTV